MKHRDYPVWTPQELLAELGPQLELKWASKLGTGPAKSSHFDSPPSEEATSEAAMRRARLQYLWLQHCRARAAARGDEDSDDTATDADSDLDQWEAKDESQLSSDVAAATLAHPHDTHDDEHVVMKHAPPGGGAAWSPAVLKQIVSRAQQWHVQRHYRAKQFKAVSVDAAAQGYRRVCNVHAVVARALASTAAHSSGTSGRPLGDETRRSAGHAESSALDTDAPPSPVSDVPLDPVAARARAAAAAKSDAASRKHKIDVFVQQIEATGRMMLSEPLPTPQLEPPTDPFLPSMSPEDRANLIVRLQRYYVGMMNKSSDAKLQAANGFTMIEDFRIARPFSAVPGAASPAPGQPIRPPVGLRAPVAPGKLPMLQTLYHRYQAGVHSILHMDPDASTIIALIAHLLTVSVTTGTFGPYMIIAPSNALRLWQHTLELVCPQLVVMPYWGHKKDRQAMRRSWDESLGLASSDFHIVLTSDSVLLQDYKFIRRVFFGVTILHLDVCLSPYFHFPTGTATNWEGITAVNSRQRIVLSPFVRPLSDVDLLAMKAAGLYLTADGRPTVLPTRLPWKMLEFLLPKALAGFTVHQIREARNLARLEAALQCTVNPLQPSESMTRWCATLRQFVVHDAGVVDTYFCPDTDAVPRLTESEVQDLIASAHVNLSSAAAAAGVQLGPDIMPIDGVSAQPDKSVPRKRGRPPSHPSSLVADEIESDDDAIRLPQPRPAVAIKLERSQDADAATSHREASREPAVAAPTTASVVGTDVGSDEDDAAEESDNDSSKEPLVAPDMCAHTETRRYGNRHATVLKCKSCNCQFDEGSQSWVRSRPRNRAARSGDFAADGDFVESQDSHRRLADVMDRVDPRHLADLANVMEGAASQHKVGVADGMTAAHHDHLLQVRQSVSKHAASRLTRSSGGYAKLLFGTHGHLLVDRLPYTVGRMDSGWRSVCEEYKLPVHPICRAAGGIDGHVAFDRSIAHRHFQIEWDAAHACFNLRVLTSTGIVRLDGDRVSPADGPLALRSGHMIDLGPYSCAFLLPAGSPANNLSRVRPAAPKYSPREEPEPLAPPSAKRRRDAASRGGGAGAQTVPRTSARKRTPHPSLPFDDDSDAELAAALPDGDEDGDSESGPAKKDLPFTCHLCGTGSNSKGGLQTHYRRYHSTKQVCSMPFCDFSCTSTKDLKTHVDDTHETYHTFVEECAEDDAKAVVKSVVRYLVGEVEYHTSNAADQAKIRSNEQSKFRRKMKTVVQSLVDKVCGDLDVAAEAEPVEPAPGAKAMPKRRASAAVAAAVEAAMQGEDSDSSQAAPAQSRKRPAKKKRLTAEEEALEQTLHDSAVRPLQLCYVRLKDTSASPNELAQGSGLPEAEIIEWIAHSNNFDGAYRPQAETQAVPIEVEEGARQMASKIPKGPLGLRTRPAFLVGPNCVAPLITGWEASQAPGGIQMGDALLAINGKILCGVPYDVACRLIGRARAPFHICVLRR